METEVNEIIKLIKKAEADDSIEKICRISDVLVLVNPATAPAILGFLIEMIPNQIAIKDHLKPSYNYLILSLLSKIKILLPESLFPLLQEIEFPLEQELNKSENVFTQLRQLVVETLIKTPRKEFENSINLFFNKNEANIKESAISISFDYLLRTNDEREKSEICKIISELATEDECHAILDFINENEDLCETLLLSLRIINKDVYDSLSDLICTDKRYFKKYLVSKLPEFNSELIIQNIKDYNWEIMEELLKRRPELSSDFINNFLDGKVGMSRATFIENILKLDYIFCYHVETINFTKEEILDVVYKSNNFAIQYFKTISTEIEMIEFCRVYSKKEENLILEFIKKASLDNNFLLFLKYITSFMRFMGELRDFVVENFASNEKYFHILLIYLDFNRIQELLELHYTPVVSLESLMKKWHPQELILEIHKFIKTEIACKLLEECTKNENFTDQDWMLSIKSLACMNSSLKIYTGYYLLINKKHLENDIIHLLRSSLEINLLEESNLQIFGKIVENLYFNSIYLFEVLEKSQIKEIMGQSESIFKIIQEIIQNSDNNTREGAHIKKIFGY